MNKLKLILSFDHELALGGTSCYKTNLFTPTDRIISLANKLGVPITLFTDILCAKRFEEWDNEGFFNPYSKQLERALRSNHDVQLHIHPHWIDSDYRNGEFIPSKSFKLSDFHNRQWPNNIQGIVEQAIDFLKKICGEYKTDYSCIAYRAGGYNLFPNTETILSSLYNSGIRIESSVTKGYYFKSGISEVNFRKMPKKANWFISQQGPIDLEADSGLYEVPIAGRPRGSINNIPFLFKRILYKSRAYDCKGIGIHQGHTPILEKIKRLFPKSVWMLSFDNYTESVESLMKIMTYHLNCHKNDKTIICSSISHPKSMGEYGLSLMEGFVQRMRKDYDDRVQFCTYQQIYDVLNITKS